VIRKGVCVDGVYVPIPIRGSAAKPRANVAVESKAKTPVQPERVRMTKIEDEIRERCGISETDYVAAKNRVVCAGGNRDGDLVQRMLSNTEMAICRNMGLNPTVYLLDKLSDVKKSGIGTALMASDLVGPSGVAPGLARMAAILMDSADVSINAEALSKVSQLEGELAFFNEAPTFDDAARIESMSRIATVIADTMQILRKSPGVVAV
jgi:hypothetical protein